MTKNQFSFAAFAEYGNRLANTANNDFRTATVNFVENTMNGIGKQFGYPTTKEELHECLEKYDGYDVSGITDQIPGLVAGFMHDEQRAFDIPAVDNKTCPATIKVVSKDEETKEGTIQFGANKGEQYKTTIEAHEELVVKNNRRPFKK